ncbi:hypothetical protein [Vulgatibacter sp.]|uniref:hypothetical protein n=1 Tax=Vulgatibacter sp. TaxID=1971226 RepID=UPI00356A1D08
MAACRASCEQYTGARVAAQCADCIALATCTHSEILCIDAGPCDKPLADLDVEGTGFTAWNGRSIRVGTAFHADGWWQDVRHAEVVVTDGTFSASLPQALRPDQDMVVAGWFDTDGNGWCSSGDATFLLPLESGAGVRLVEFDAAATASPDGCNVFGEPYDTLFVGGSGFEAHEGQWVVVAESRGGEVHTGRIERGRFEVRFDWLWSGSFELDWMIDDGDWVCEEGTDVGGKFSVEIGAPQTNVSLAPADAGTGFCAPLDFLATP